MDQSLMTDDCRYHDVPTDWDVAVTDSADWSLSVSSEY